MLFSSQKAARQDRLRGQILDQMKAQGTAEAEVAAFPGTDLNDWVEAVDGVLSLLPNAIGIVDRDQGIVAIQHLSYAQMHAHLDCVAVGLVG